MADFALVTTPFTCGFPLISQKIRDFEEVLVAGKEFAELKGRVFQLKELAQYPWISLLPGTATRDYYDTFFSAQSLEFKPQFLAATTDQILPMIKAGLGIGFVPVNMLDNKDNDVFPIPFHEEIVPRSVHLITDQTHPLSAAAKRLIKMILLS